MAQRSRARHAAGNLILAGINATVLAVVFSGATVAMAEVSASRHWGLLHSVDLTTSVRVALAFLFLDAWNYGWHRLNHRFPILWRFHQVHHSDPVMDVSTATRFHCGEIAISATLRLPLIPILARISILALARSQYTPALPRRPRLFVLNPAHHLRR